MSQKYKSLIQPFIRSLSKHDRKLLNDYIFNNYAPKVRTGKGIYNNFLKEHNHQKGLDVVREILKFKKLQKLSTNKNNG